MGKGVNNFRTCQIIKGIPLNHSSLEPINLIDNLSKFELPEFHQTVIDTIKHYIIKARTKYRLNADILPMPNLSYKLRGDCAGVAIYSENEIRLNPVYLETYTYDMLTNTIPHEIAHLVTRKLYGFKVATHGKEWQNVCLDLGHVPTVRHSYGTYKQASQDLVNSKVNSLSADDF